jgi:hypothetical protein
MHTFSLLMMSAALNSSVTHYGECKIGDTLIFHYALLHSENILCCFSKLELEERAVYMWIIMDPFKAT